MPSPHQGALTRLGKTALETLAQATGQQNVGQRERWISAAAGGGLVLAGLARGKLSGLLMVVGGGALLYRGVTGHCTVYHSLNLSTVPPRPPATSVPAQEGYRVQQAVSIDRPPAEVYRFWRKLENLPKIMDHLVSVTPLGSNRSHWTARGPMGATVEWDAELHNERENELIAWRSLPGAEVDTAGSVHFEPTKGGRGTHLWVTLKYNPPAGKVGARIASILGSDVERQLDQDLQKLKRLLEAEASPVVADEGS